MKWLCADSLYCAEQFPFSHLDSYSHYLREAGETVNAEFLSGGSDAVYRQLPHDGIESDPDVLFALDDYARTADWEAGKRIAQVAAICKTMPWDVRNTDGSPAYDLVISSIPWMVEAARAKGCRAEHQRLCFDPRALVCSMGVEKDIDCLFVGTRDGNHVKREAVLGELGDLVTIGPPTFGREYYRLLARAKIIVHVGAEWSRGSRNALRLYEGAGLGAVVISDGAEKEEDDDFGVQVEEPAQFRSSVEQLLRNPQVSPAIDDWASQDQAKVLTQHTYIQRIPQLIAWARSL